MSAVASPEVDTSLGLLNVLVIDDSAIDADLLIRQLRRFGYAPRWKRVDNADDLRNALAIEHWDVILSDYSMPGFDGLEALRIVQSFGLETPFLIVSGAIGEETAVAAMRDGAHDYLLKDRLARLGAAVQRRLQEAEQRRVCRHAEEQVRLLFHAVEQSPAIVAITDTEGRIEYVNPRFTELTGYALDEVRGKNPRILKHDDVPTSVYAGLWEAITAGGEWRGEFANRKKNGDVFWEAACISPVRNRSGEVTHFIKVAEDITERRRVEESLCWLETQLRQAQKMEAFGELATGIAHDFNSFLGAIIMNAQLVRKEVADDSAAAETAERILQASRQAAGLARQMLTFSRREEQQRCPMILAGTVREALRLLQPTVPENVEVCVDIASNQRTVLADPSQVQQLVINLWTNACHAIESGHGRIAVTVSNIDVDRETAEQYPDLDAGPYVRLSVEDDGCGITPELAHEIFEPFVTTKPEGQGTGLGLAVVRNIVKAHGGAVHFESQPGEGSTFHVYFPEHLTDATDVSGPLQPSPHGKGQRILLVDDHSLVREALRSMLVELRYQVTSHGNPVEALKSFGAAHRDFDLAIIDLSMKEMTGAELARQFSTIRPGFPIILTSGYELSARSHHLRDLGIVEVLPKPVSPERLATTVARILADTGTVA